MEFETLFDRLSLPPLRSSVFPPPSVWSSTSTAQAGFGPCRQRLRGPNGPRASRVRRQAAPAWAIERAALVHAHNPAARPLRQPRLARQRGRPALLGQAGAADRSRPALRALESATWLMGELYRAAGFEGVAKHVEYVLATQPAESRPLFVPGVAPQRTRPWRRRDELPTGPSPRPRTLRSSTCPALSRSAISTRRWCPTPTARPLVLSRQSVRSNQLLSVTVIVAVPVTA